MTAFRNPNWDKKSPQSAPNCIAGGRGLTQSLARASSPRATAGRFVESRRATNGFHTRSDARAPIAACGPPKSPILPELCRTHLGLLDARAEFAPGILVLLQCGALRRPALPGMQSREHDPERFQGPRCEMQHKRQSLFAFVLRRCLTWFYPQVCRNQALSGVSTFFVLPLHVGNRLRRLLTRPIPAAEQSSSRVALRSLG